MTYTRDCCSDRLGLPGKQMLKWTLAYRTFTRECSGDKTCAREGTGLGRGRNWALIESQWRSASTTSMDEAAGALELSWVGTRASEIGALKPLHWLITSGDRQAFVKAASLAEKTPKEACLLAVLPAAGGISPLFPRGDLGVTSHNALQEKRKRTKFTIFLHSMMLFLFYLGTNLGTCINNSNLSFPYFKSNLGLPQLSTRVTVILPLTWQLIVILTLTG